MRCVSMARRFLPVLCLFVVLVSPSLVLAQSTGSASLAGAVLDPDGKAAAAAAIVVRNEASSEIRSATTDGGGHFTVSGLAAATYTAEVFVPGFDTIRRAGLQLIEGRTEEISFRLTVANIQ